MTNKYYYKKSLDSLIYRIKMLKERNPEFIEAFINKEITRLERKIKQLKSSYKKLLSKAT